MNSYRTILTAVSDSGKLPDVGENCLIIFYLLGHLFKTNFKS